MKKILIFFFFIFVVGSIVSIKDSIKDLDWRLKQQELLMCIPKN